MIQSKGTKHVLVTGDVDLLDPQGNGWRVPVSVMVEAAVDEACGVPVAMRFRDGDIRGKEQLRLLFGAHHLGPLQNWNPDDVAIPNLRTRDRRRAEEVSLYDLTHELRFMDDHAITGEQNPQRPTDGLSVALDGTVGSARTAGAVLYDLSPIAAHVQAVRSMAAERLLYREPQGWFVPAVLPSFHLKQDAVQDPAWRVVVSASLGRPETRFGLDRFEEARAFCRHLNGGIDGEVAGEVLEADPNLLPVSNDLAVLASKGAPQAVGVRMFAPNQMSASLVVDWHVARNARSIVEMEGGAGVERVLTSCLRLADHLEGAGFELDRVREWALLKARILFEGIEPVPASPGFRP